MPVSTLMPCRLKDFSSSADTASSSIGTRRGKSSTIVTSLPKRRKIDANSTPTAPLPRITIDLGISFSPMASSLVMIRFRSISIPGTLRGCDPVATMISRRRRQHLRLAVGDLDPALARQAAAALDPVNLVLLEQELDAAGEALDDLVFSRLHLRHVDADRGLAERQTPVLPLLCHLEGVGVFEERLRRNAAPIEAGTAERRRAFDDRGPQTRAARPGWRPRSPRSRSQSQPRRTRSQSAYTKPSGLHSGLSKPSGFFLWTTAGQMTPDAAAAGASAASFTCSTLVQGPAATPASAGGCSRSAVPSTTGSARRAAATGAWRTPAPPPRREVQFLQRPREPQPI